MCTHTFYNRCHIFFNKMYALQGLFKFIVQEKVDSVQLRLILQKNVYTLL